MFNGKHYQEKILGMQIVKDSDSNKSVLKLLRL